jgi:HEAT repeat protein
VAPASDRAWRGAGDPAYQEMFFFIARQARSSWAPTRKRAAQKLAAGGRLEGSGPLPRHVSVLLELVKDADADVRAVAYEGLGRVADGRAVADMAAGLKDVDKLGEPGAAAVREAAARAFQGIGVSAVPALEQLTKDKSQKAREAAVAALGGIGGADAERALVAALQDNRSSVRQLAVRALARTAVAGSIGSLSAALEHRDPATRRSAVEAVVDMKVADAVPSLARLTRDADSNVREAAVRALGRHASPQAIDALIVVFEAPDRALRQLAAAALNDLEWQPATAEQRALRAILRGEYQVAAAEGEAAIEPLSALVADKSAAVRRAVAEALGLTAQAAAVRPLLQALQDGDAAVRQAAADALVRIGVPAAAPLACAIHETVRTAAPDLLARIGGAAAAPLLQLLEQGEPFVRDGAQVRRVADEQESEQAARVAHLLTRLLGHAARDVDRDALGRIAHLRDIVRVREVMPVNRRESVTTVIDTVVDAQELRDRAAAELGRRKS